MKTQFRTHTKTLQLHDWMLRLGLTESEERVYALIYGYTQDGVNRYKSTAGSIAEWLHCSASTAKRVLRGLTSKGLIGHETISWSNGKEGGVMTEFWTIDPEDAASPEFAPEKITWKRREGVGSRMTRPHPGGRVTDDTTPYKDSSSINKLSRSSCKNNARSRANTTTTTTLCLFENESGLAPGTPAVLPLPFEEDYFVEAWGRLLREPKWSGKTPGQLDQQLQTFRETNDPVLCAYCIDLAIRMGWAYIDDPAKIGVADQDKVLAFAEKLNAAREEGAAA